jgi:hypothetical protein
MMEFDENDEIIEIDAETEDLAYALTLLLKELKPEIDCGGTYEIVVYLLVQFLHEQIEPITIKEYSRRIEETSKIVRQKH